MIDLKAINRRYDAVCDLAETNSSSATTGAALAYAMDVPAMIAELTMLREALIDKFGPDVLDRFDNPHCLLVL
jgi:hypothetical protein